MTVQVKRYPVLLDVPLPDNKILYTYACNWKIKQGSKTLFKQRDLYLFNHKEYFKAVETIKSLNIKDAIDVYIEKRRVVITYKDNYKVQLTHYCAGKHIEQAYMHTSSTLYNLEDIPIEKETAKY